MQSCFSESSGKTERRVSSPVCVHVCVCVCVCTGDRLSFPLAASAAEIVDDRHFDVFKSRDDEDYECFEEEEEEEEDEEEKERREKILHPWLDVCEDLLPLADDEEDPPDTTEPYVSHAL